MVADAHHTGFPDGAFDLIRGNSILHHLELEPALRELRRILAPGGRAVFVEPLAHNPLLRLGRALTPMARTEDEHPFTAADWDTCAAVFPGFRHFERELITVPLMPLNLVLPARGRAALATRVKVVGRARRGPRAAPAPLRAAHVPDPAVIVTVPVTQVTVPPPTQIVPSSSRLTWTRPARPSAVPWRAT